MADDRPGDAQISQVLALALGLLDLVLTHLGDTRGEGGTQALLGDGLGHRQQTDLGGVAAGALRGGVDSGADGGQVAAEVLHRDGGGVGGGRRRLRGMGG